MFSAASLVRRMRYSALVALALTTLLGSPSSSASELESGSGFGGPDATDNTIAKDRDREPSLLEADLLESWQDWKNGLTERTGVSFGLDYSSLLLSGDGFEQNYAGGGIARLYGSWDLVDRGGPNSGALIWKVEHRHGYTTPAPSGFALGELGYVGLQEPPFSDQGLRATNLYWRQRLGDGRVTLIAGFLDSTDYVDVYALASPWMHFMNFAFSTGSATIALPNDAALGIAAGAMLTDNVFVIAGLTDTNSDPTEVFDGFDTFFGDNEYFKSIDIGWTSSQERIALDNYHVTVWHKDRQEKAGVPDGWGVNLSFSRYVQDRWLPFLRAGWSKDGGSLLEKSVSAGLGYQPRPGADLLGLGLNWGDPNSDAFGSDLDDQYTLEVFYRLNVGPEITMTFDIQYLRDPALNPDEDDIVMGNLRLRLAI